MKILIAQINPTVGDLKGNSAKIISAIQAGQKQQVTLVILPELAITGYSPQDFLLHSDFIDEVELSLEGIASQTAGVTVIVGTPRRNTTTQGKPFFNSAAICQNGKLIGYQDKMLLPTYDVFNEQRYFEPAKEMHLWSIGGKKIGITICEDIWRLSALDSNTSYERDPVQELKQLRPDFLVNLSASPFSVNKGDFRYFVCKKAAQALDCPVILCNQVGGNDSLIYDGRSLVVSKEGSLLMRAKEFAEDLLVVDLKLPLRGPSYVDNPKDTIFKALVLGVRDYFWKSGFKSACLGLSGGIDSAVVACIAVAALGKENVIGISMPSRYSSEGSKRDAAALARNLGIDYLTIPIDAPFQSYLDTLAPALKGSATELTEENLQARVRGMILMAYSNNHGCITLNTGNKSELAVGYCTLYGDMCGGLSVINDLTKRQVYAVAGWINRATEVIPLSIIQKPPSAELRPNQLDSDTLPEYDILDNIVDSYVEHYMPAEIIAERFGYPLELVKKLVRQIHLNEYKRRQSPLGLRITEKSFSAGRVFPIVQGFVR